MIRHEVQQAPETFDLNKTGTPYVLWPCGPFTSAAIQAVPSTSNTTWRLTVIVSNDPKKSAYENHPSGITLQSTAQITPVFSVAGYLYVGVKLSTAAAATVQSDLFCVLKDSV